MSEAEERIYLNGIYGVTENYLIQPMSAAEAVAMARGKPEDSGLKGWMKSIWESMQRPFMGLPMDIDPTDVARAGWAVVFTPDTPAEVRDALQPLIAHRQLAWIERNDAQDYVVLGDPAVRVRVDRLN